MVMQTSAAGIALIKSFEGCKLGAYYDSVGVLTIGYGDTGPDVKPGLVISQEEADRRFAGRLSREFEPGVRAAIEDAPTTQGQFDAMVSLAYNIGVGGFKGSTVARMHKAGNYTAAAEAFSLWVKANGRVLAGLVRRRGEEAKLYLSDVRQAAASEREIEAAIRDFESKARSLQMHLQAAGLYNLKIDGDWGAGSQKALAEWRAAHPA